ncbi:hypothetical protein PR048_006662 [Dryococelus australis]|uniref:Uncharacterized protein n=1 Tax=Dryococelus australis TaxID=614101 RepID=A0ABQ9IC80_9NEOP|nr:hypothetical protein PR048_006662 [Dryococelus australis]
MWPGYIQLDRTVASPLSTHSPRATGEPQNELVGRHRHGRPSSPPPSPSHQWSSADAWSICAQQANDTSFPPPPKHYGTLSRRGAEIESIISLHTARNNRSTDSQCCHSALHARCHARADINPSPTPSPIVTQPQRSGPRRPTFTDVSLLYEPPQHVGAVVAVCRLVERLLGERVPMARRLLVGRRHVAWAAPAPLSPDSHREQTPATRITSTRRTLFLRAYGAFPSERLSALSQPTMTRRDEAGPARNPPRAAGPTTAQSHRAAAADRASWRRHIDPVDGADEVEWHSDRGNSDVFEERIADMHLKPSRVYTESVAGNLGENPLKNTTLWDERNEVVMEQGWEKRNIPDKTRRPPMSSARFLRAKIWEQPTENRTLFALVEGEHPSRYTNVAAMFVIGSKSFEVCQVNYDDTDLLVRILARQRMNLHIFPITSSKICSVKESPCHKILNNKIFQQPPMPRNPAPHASKMAALACQIPDRHAVCQSVRGSQFALGGTPANLSQYEVANQSKNSVPEPSVADRLMYTSTSKEPDSSSLFHFTSMLLPILCREGQEEDGGNIRSWDRCAVPIVCAYLFHVATLPGYTHNDVTTGRDQPPFLPPKARVSGHIQRHSLVATGWEKFTFSLMEDTRTPFPTSGATVAQRLACSPSTKVNRVQTPTRVLPDFRFWESCWTMPLVGGFSQGSPFPRPFIPALLHATSITLIGCQGMTFKNSPNVVTSLPAWVVQMHVCLAVLRFLPDKPSSLARLCKETELLSNCRNVSHPFMGCSFINGRIFLPVWKCFVRRDDRIVYMCRVSVVGSAAICRHRLIVRATIVDRTAIPKQLKGCSRLNENLATLFVRQYVRCVMEGGRTTAATKRLSKTQWFCDISRDNRGISRASDRTCPRLNKLDDVRFGNLGCHVMLLQQVEQNKSLVTPTKYLFRGSGGALAGAPASHQGDTGSIPGGFAPRFSHVGIVLDDAACRRAFSRNSRFPRPPIPAPLHPRVSLNVMFRDDGHLRVPAGKPITRRVLPRPGSTRFYF